MELRSTSDDLRSSGRSLHNQTPRSSPLKVPKTPKPQLKHHNTLSHASPEPNKTKKVEDLDKKGCFKSICDAILQCLHSLADFICTIFNLGKEASKNQVEELLELTENGSANPNTYLRLYYKLPEPVRDEITEIGRQYVAAETLFGISSDKEVDGRDFYDLIHNKDNQEKIQSWLDSNGPFALQKALLHLSKERIGYYAVDTILSTYLYSLRTNSDN